MYKNREFQQQKYYSHVARGIIRDYRLLKWQFGELDLLPGMLLLHHVILVQLLCRWMFIISHKL